MNCSTGFRLRLANGQEWLLTACASATPWLQRLAFIMELQPVTTSSARKLIFVTHQNERLDIERSGLDRTPFSVGEAGSLLRWHLVDFGFLRFWMDPGFSDVFCELGIEEGGPLDIVRMWTALGPILTHVSDVGGLLIHACLVAHGDHGALLVGHGDSGKSTCAKRIPPPWRALSDDLALMVKMDERSYHAHPFPTWSDHWLKSTDKTWNVEEHVPVEAIFFLQKAHEDKVRRLGQGEASVWLHQFTDPMRQYQSGLEDSRKAAVKQELFESACGVAGSIRCFVLNVSPTGQFWKKIEPEVRK